METKSLLHSAPPSEEFFLPNEEGITWKLTTNRCLSLSLTNSWRLLLWPPRPGKARHLLNALYDGLAKAHVANLFCDQLRLRWAVSPHKEKVMLNTAATSRLSPYSTKDTTLRSTMV